MSPRFGALLGMLGVLLGAPLARADAQDSTYRPVVSVISFLGPGGESLRNQVAAILEADPRLQVLPPELFEHTGQNYGYTLEDLTDGDGVQVVSRDTQLDGVLTGRIQKIGNKYDLILRVYDGGTGLSLLATTLTLPRLTLRQGEKERISGEVAQALTEVRLALPPQEPEPQPAAQKSKRQKEGRRRQKPAPSPALSVEDPPEIRPKREPRDKPEKKPRPGSGGPFGGISLAAGPAFSGRFATIQAVDQNGTPLENFQPTQYAAPAYGGAAGRLTLAPASLLGKGPEEPNMVLEAGFSRSLGLSSNLNGEAINTLAQELSAGMQLRFPLGGLFLAVRGEYLSYEFAFLPSAEQEAAGVGQDLLNLGLVDLRYQVIGAGPELQLPLFSPKRLLFLSGTADMILSPGAAAIAGYGLTEGALGFRAELGARLRLGGSLLAEPALFVRRWQLSYEGAGALLDGEASRTTDFLFGGALTLGYVSR